MLYCYVFCLETKDDNVKNLTFFILEPFHYIEQILSVRERVENSAMSWLKHLLTHCVPMIKRQQIYIEHTWSMCVNLK